LTALSKYLQAKVISLM